MRYVYNFLIILSFLTLPQVALAVDSCECPKLTCRKECEIETDVTFYSEKCENGNRVKSCARPTCQPMQNAPEECGFAAQTPKLPDSSVAQGADSRAPSSIAPIHAVIGKAKLVEGKAFRSSLGKEYELKVGDEVRENDKLRTEDNSKLQIEFKSGNLLNLTPNSEVLVSDASDSSGDMDKKKMVLELLRGRIRNKVEKQKYNNNEKSHYRVKMAGAVAGVRGTDFVASLEFDGDEVVSKIDTLNGEVELADEKYEQKSYAKVGETVSFVAPKESVMTSSDRKEMAIKGYFTPVAKLTDKQYSELDNSTAVAKSDLRPTRTAASDKDDQICKEPKAKFNQCSWTCENNPDGQSKCRTDLPNVSCVRRVCNANGKWSDPMRLPSSYQESCSAEKPIVGPCDY